MIELSIFLYGKPSWDLEIEGKEKMEPKMFAEHGDYLKYHLHQVADILGKLQAHGWKVEGTLYTLIFHKEIINTKKEAIKELDLLGIDKNYVSIEEPEEEYLYEPELDYE